MNRKIGSILTPYIQLLPITILLVIFLAGLINSVLQSFGYAPFMNMYEPTLDYYIETVQDERVGSSILYSLYLAAACTIAAVICAIVLSAVLTHLRAGNAMQLAAINVPLSVAHIVVVILIIVMFGSSGMLARVLYALGIIDSAQSIPTVIGAQSGWGIILVFIFKETPYIALCTITLMMNIGNRYSEAAACLGANPMRTFFSITLPLCKNAITRAALVVFAFAFGSYEIPYLLAPTEPKTIAVLAFNEFQLNDITNRCYSMAIVAIMVGITLVVAIIYFVLMGRDRKGISHA